MSERKFDEMLEDLYDLDRSELRRLAYEALLISDGPDSPLRHENPGTAIVVRCQIHPDVTIEFKVTAREEVK